MTQPTDAGMTQLLDRMRADLGGHVSAAAQAGVTADAGDGALANMTLAGRIEAHLGSLARGQAQAQARAAAQLARRQRGIAPVWLPPIPFKPVAGVLAVDPAGRASSADFAPQDGYVWFLTHLVVAGLLGAGGAAGVQTLASYGEQTNPVAGTTITSLTLPAGTWDIAVSPGFQGTLTATDTDNMQLTLPTGGPFTLLANSTTQGSAQDPAIPFRVVVPQGGGTVAIKAIVNASGASAIYRGALYASPSLAVSGDQVSLYKVTGSGLNNFLHTFTSAAPDWQLSSSSVFLLPDDSLTLTGTGVQASQLLLTGQGVQVELPLVADYLM